MSKLFALKLCLITTLTAAASGCYVRGRAEMAPPPPATVQVQGTTAWKSDGWIKVETGADGSISTTLPPPIDLGWCTPGTSCPAEPAP